MESQSAGSIIKELIRNTDMTLEQIETYLAKKSNVDHRWKVHIVSHAKFSGIVRYMGMTFHYYKYSNGKIDVSRY